jgi:hypothetical protein
LRRGKKIVRKDKPKRERWVVVDPIGRLKYPAKLGEDVIGFEKEQAERLAEPGHPSHTWRALPIGVWKGEHDQMEGLQ